MDDNQFINKSKGLTVVFVIAITVIGIVIGAVTVYHKTSLDYKQQLDIIKTELEADYANQINDLHLTIDALEKDIQSHKQSSSSVIQLNASDHVSIENISESVMPSIVTILINVPSMRYQNGFYSYNTGGLSSSGTGIVLNKEGYIVTNYHVVEYFDQYDNVSIDVVLSDGSEYSAQFIGGDKNNDLAVVKIEANENLVPAVLGSSDDLRVGEVVLAIGNPLGIEFAGSVTMGIVSALDRVVSEENTAESLIQTDAAINPGNSGGALVNTNGEIVGITTLKVAKTEVEGLGFAIPIDYAKPIISDLIEYGYVKDRPATGISGSNVTSTISRYYGVPLGVIVTQVEEDSGAYLAGLEPNDIITELDGVAIESMADIQDINKTHKVGDIVEVVFFRNGKFYSSNLILMEDRGR